LNKKSVTWRILNDQDYRYGKIFAVALQVLILISLVTFSMETLPSLSEQTHQILQLIETVTVIIFTIEYFLRLFTAEKKISFIFSFYGLVDLTAILPFYLFTGVDLRSVRIFRLLRLIRILKLLKYHKALHRFYRAAIIAKEELAIFAFIIFILLYLSAVGIYYFEHQVQPELFASIFHSLWWAITTLSTVGYGDMYPITTGGRVFTFIVLAIGLGVVAAPIGIISAALSQAKAEDK